MLLVLAMAPAFAAAGATEPGRVGDGERASPSSAWALLVDYDRVPIWIERGDLANFRAARSDEVRLLRIELPAKEAVAPGGWVWMRVRLDCVRNHVRILEANAAKANGARRAPDIPAWYRPAASYEPPPHTPLVAVMAAACDREPGPARTVVRGAAQDVYTAQARLRQQALGF